MSDWHETNEIQEQETSLPSHREVLGAEGRSSFKGDVKPAESGPPLRTEQADETKPKDSSKNTDGSERLVTIRPKKSPEHLPNVEAEGCIVDLNEDRRDGKEGKVKPPPGFRPGGPERGW
jgi:hypothetical protein